MNLSFMFSLSLTLLDIGLSRWFASSKGLRSFGGCVAVAVTYFFIPH